MSGVHPFVLLAAVLFLGSGDVRAQGAEQAMGAPLLPGRTDALGHAPSLRSVLLLPAPQQITAPMGLFCKLDVELERTLRIPVVVRLGDALQVDAWEGKGPYRSTAPLRP